MSTYINIHNPSNYNSSSLLISIQQFVLLLVLPGFTNHSHLLNVCKLIQNEFKLLFAEVHDNWLNEV